jgi:hypothetical protein
MKRYFTKTFVWFLVAFLGILSVAFGVATIAGMQTPAVDNSASRG